MKFICLTIPAHGHMNPILGVLRELVKDKHEVIVVNTPEFKKKIEDIGAKFYPPPINIPDIDLRIARDALKMSEILIDVTKLVTTPLIKVIEKEKPDCLLYDSLNVWGKLASLQTGVKTVAFSTTMAVNSRVIVTWSKYLIPDYLNFFLHPLRTYNLLRNIRLISRKYHVPYSALGIFSNENGPNVVFTSKYFQIESGSFGNNFKFVGPIIYDRKEEQLPPNILQKNKPIIYIALGTIHNDDIQVYKNFIEVFANTPYEVVISIGRHISISQLGEIPNNIYVKNYIPQLQVLKKASLFISHAGMNSINESLYFGVPLILLPLIHEQRVNAGQVEKIGAGIYYTKKTIDKDLVYRLAEKVLHTPSYKKNAQKISRSLQTAGGAREAVRYIYQYLKS